MLKVMVCDQRNIVGAFRGRLVRLLHLAAPREWKDAVLSLAVVNGREMAVLNRRFTGRRGETDVLAFPLEDGIGFPPPALPRPGAGADKARRRSRGKAGPATMGEIAVNSSLAAREAKARGASAWDELALYVVHGALHLAGYDDHDARCRQRMYRREEELLRRAGIPCVRSRPRRKGGARNPGGRRLGKRVH